jgi:hypothetical protein
MREEPQPLEADYETALLEWSSSEDAALWESVVADGLDPE